MDWIAIVVAVVLNLGAAFGVESWRVPLIRKRAAQQGFEDRSSSVGPEVEKMLRGDGSLFASNVMWGFGFILTRRLLDGGDLWISEVRLAGRRGTRWHVMVSMHMPVPDNKTAVLQAVSRLVSDAECATDLERIVWRRPGLLWPKRLGTILGQAENVRKAIASTAAV